jgi:hypothetical protein
MHWWWFWSTQDGGKAYITTCWFVFELNCFCSIILYYVINFSGKGLAMTAEICSRYIDFMLLYNLSSIGRPFLWYFVLSFLSSVYLDALTKGCW